MNINSYSGVYLEIKILKEELKKVLFCDIVDMDSDSSDDCSSSDTCSEIWNDDKRGGDLCHETWDFKLGLGLLFYGEFSEGERQCMEIVRYF